MKTVVSSVLIFALFVVPLAQAQDTASKMQQEAQALAREGAALAAEAEKLIGKGQPEKVAELLKQSEEKMARARALAGQAGVITPEQAAGQVVGYGGKDPKGNPDPKHPDNLREATQNPVASLISVPLESNFNFDVGPEGNTQYVMNAKPVIPMNVNEDWNWIHRGIQPIIVQDNLTDSPSGDLETDSSIFGLGDLTYQGFLTPKKAGKVIWGVGGLLVVPWGEDGISTEKWQTGPAAVALTKRGKWVFGSVISQQWDVAGRGSAEDVSLAVWQYFINYNLDKGWFLLSTPTMSANWEAEKSGDRLTVPVGGGVGRLFKLGGKPYRASIQAYGYPASPDNVDTDWSIQAEFRLLFPK